MRTIVLAQHACGLSAVPLVLQVVKRSKPTKIAFNAVQPIVIIGDDHGSVVALKLSPNLRKVNV